MVEHDHPTEITSMLQRWKSGDRSVEDQLVASMYPMFRNLARKHLTGLRGAVRLQTTELVNEAYLKLAAADTNWRDRVHFTAFASKVIRSLVVDFFRKERSVKRGGDHHIISLDDAASEPASQRLTMDWLFLDQLLNELSETEPLHAKVLELRYFGGMTVEEVAEACDVSVATVGRIWRFTKAWLHRRMDAG